MINARSVAVAIAAASVAGCSSFQNINNTMKRGDDTAATASEMVSSLQKQQPRAPQRDTVVFSDTPIVSLTPLTIAKPVNPRESLRCDISFSPSAPMDILEFGQFITNKCGIPVRVTPDALTALNGQLGAAPSNSGTVQGPSVSQLNVGQPLPTLPSLPTNSGASSTAARLPTLSSSSPAGMIANIKWQSRPLEGLLDVVTSRLGLSWRRVDGMISIYYLDTQTFNIYAIPSTTDMTSVVQSGTTTAAGVTGSSAGSGSGGVSGNSGSNQTTSVTNKSSITDDIVRNVKAMLTPGVGRISEPTKDGMLGSSTGTILVTDTPEVLARIRSYLSGENKNITKQVLLNVRVLSVTLTDSDNMGIDWNLIYKTLSGKYGVSLSNTFQASAGAISGTISVPSTATGGASEFAGSSLIVKALSQQGRVSTVTSPSVTTLNMQPVPVQVARQTSYLASIQTTSTAQVGSTTSLTPGTITTGFNMNLLPYVMPDNNLLLQYSINLSALQRIRQVSSGGNTIEIPEVDNRIFNQKVRLKSGETLVLSGFEQSIDNGTRAGVGNPNNILLGGGFGTDNRRDVIVVLITPVVMD